MDNNGLTVLPVASFLFCHRTFHRVKAGILEGVDGVEAEFCAVLILSVADHSQRDIGISQALSCSLWSFNQSINQSINHIFLEWPK